MGYILKPNGLTTYKTIVPAASLLTMGTSPVSLNYFDNSQFNGVVFIPIIASMRLVNNTVTFDFGAQAHPRITGQVEFVWDKIIDSWISDIAVYPALYFQTPINLSGGAVYTGNEDGMKQGVGIKLRTNNNADATQGDGEMHIAISGYFTTI